MKLKYENEDVVMSAFLDLLERDIEQHPEKIIPASADEIQRAIDLLDGNLDIDLDTE